MRNLLTLLSVIGITSQSIATLAPTQCAPIGKHLMEVNKEWAHMWPEMANSSNQISFENEAERISLHLTLISSKLYDSNNSRKSRLLNELNDYAKEQVFPRNNILPYRNPIFIDEQNTACAVGHLMRISGAIALAEAIDSRMETYFIEDMNMPQIVDWAQFHGFSQNELAWIQPGYPPSTNWLAVGGGVNGEVDVAITLANSDVVIAGNFDLGNPGITTVARWDGAQYTAIGATLPGEVTDIAEFNGYIYVSGGFYQLNAFYDHAWFDGQNWNLQTAFPGLTPFGTDLHVHNNELHIAGSADGFAGTSFMVLRLQNGQWNMIGNELNDTIQTMETHNSTLFVGGDFTAPFGSTSNSLKHVATLNAAGIWSEWLGGLNGSVHDLNSFSGNLYAAGELGDMATPRFGLSVFYPNGSSWTDLLPGHENTMFPFHGESLIRDIEFIGSNLFAGGNFDVQPLLGTVGQNIMWIDLNGGGYAMPMATMNGRVNCITESGSSEFYMGGDFDTLNYQVMEHFVQSDFTISSIDEFNKPGFSVWPNPTNGIINVDFKGFQKNELLLIHASDGTLIHQEPFGNSTLRVDLSQLPNGAYLARRTGSKETVRFVLER